ncbi:MAG: P-II family nitrogen regulator [Betaproteobacteria bacterium]|nr:P-II family nitrogen regulator [Betaproteobacteria bacterium]
MKQITAIIQPHMLEKVEHALHELKHFPGYTVLRGHGESRGRDSGHAHHATEWGLGGHNHAVLLIVSPDELAAGIAETIRSHARTGLRGDGLITISPIDEVIRIRTDEHGDAAL